MPFRRARGYRGLVSHILYSVSLIASSNLESGHESDDRSSFAKVPATFATLVKERGPLGAVRAIVGLFMPVS